MRHDRLVQRHENSFVDGTRQRKAKKSKPGVAERATMFLREREITINQSTYTVSVHVLREERSLYPERV